MLRNGARRILGCIVVGRFPSWAWFVVLSACSSSEHAGSTWVVEEAQYSSASLYSFPPGTSIWLEDDALVLSRGAVERRIPARISRSGSTTTIELVSDKGSTRLELVRGDDGRMDLVRDGGYRLSLKEAGQ